MKTAVKSRVLRHTVLVFIFVALLGSCNLIDLQLRLPSKNMKIDQVIEVASQTISSSGGVLVVEDAASPVNGLQLVVPAGSYSTSASFKVSTSIIVGHELGSNFHPITPLILIESDGGYAKDIMEITIPIEISGDEIPLGFYYNELEGTLESIPVKEYTNTSITLLTRHFMGASQFLSEKDLKSQRVPTNDASKLVISSISESLINLTPVISSGFKVGTDDWEFTNYGSYIASGGHCAGQNMAAMWYYFEHTLKGEDPLFGKFSTHDNLWQDNAVGYRFCSVIHNDLDWDGYVTDLFDKYIDKNQSLDKMKFYTVAGAMLVTGEPQGIGIYRQTGTRADGTPKYGGHDLICYQVAPNEGKLFISDPNKPGNGQAIYLKNDKFEPYIAKVNGNAASNPYPFVTYYAKTAYIEWDKITSRYTELLDSTIGNNAPNIFPPYSIIVKTLKKEDEVPLWNGITLSNDTLRCIVECPTATVCYTIDNRKLIGFNIYDENGQEIQIQENGYQKYVVLKPGLNKLAFYVYAWRENSKYDNGNYIDKFIDFKWFNVYNSKLRIEPNPVDAETNEEIEFEAVFEGQLPASVRYVWDFGDKSKKQTIENDNTVTYKYENEGEYEVTLEVYDNSNNTLIDKATAEVTITKPNDDLAKLKKCEHLDFDVSFDYYTSKPEYEFGGGMDFIRAYNDTKMTWSGNSFTITRTVVSEYDELGNKYPTTETITGTVSADTKTLTSFTYDRKDEVYYSYRLHTTEIEKITLINVPIEYAKDEIIWGWGPADHFQYSLKKDEILSHITDFTYGSYGIQWSSDAGDYVPFDWQWGKSHIVEFWDEGLVIKFWETTD